MKNNLLNYLECRKCGSSFELKTRIKEKEEIIDGILKCRKCKDEYFIINGVPRFANRSFDKKILSTAKAFGYEWKVFSDIYSHYEQQFLDWIHPIKSNFFAGKLILDAGCGTGRHAYFSAKYGGNVIGIDISDAVEIAFRNTRQFKNVNIIQADIYNLPFKKEIFDYVYSIGVLHHLPKPQEGFNSLLRFLKKKGAISVWVYGKENNSLLRFADPVRKCLLSKLPLPATYFLSFSTACAIYPLIKLIYPLIDRITNNDKLKSQIPQFNFFIYLSKLNFKIIHSIVFDQMLAPIANYYTKSEFEKWFKDAKLKKVCISWRNKNSWRGFATK